MKSEILWLHLAMDIWPSKEILMFYLQPIVSNKVIKSDIEVLIDQFLQGEYLTIKLSSYILNNIDHICEKTYEQYLNKIKQILTYAKINYYHDLIIIKSPIQVTESERAVLVRFINLCALRRTKIIIFNNSVIYIPKDLKNFGNEILNNYINSVFHSYIKKRKIKIFAYKFGLKGLYNFVLVLKNYFKIH